MNQRGNVLITLLIFMVVAITVITGAVTMSVINVRGISEMEQSTLAYKLAEAGMENALINLLRNPNYTGETFNINGDTVTITVIGDSSKTVVSETTLNGLTKKIRVEGLFTNGAFDVTSWKEIE